MGGETIIILMILNCINEKPNGEQNHPKMPTAAEFLSGIRALSYCPLSM